ncbi:MAG: hypothetical protein ACKO32_13260 [Planctomycetia bacterium]
MLRNFSPLFVTACLSALAGACRTQTVRESARVAESQPVTSAAVRAFELRVDGRARGSLVRYEEQGKAARSFYTVRNELGQAVGLIDAEGRAYRYRPHQPEAEWLGTGTVLEGAQRVLGIEVAAELIEVGLSEAAH